MGLEKIDYNETTGAQIKHFRIDFGTHYLYISLGLKAEAGVGNHNCGSQGASEKGGGVNVTNLS